MKIDTSKWGEFLIGDLFEKCDLKCKKANFNKAIDCSEIYNEEFSLPLVNAKHTNNGIQFYGRANEWDTEEMTLDIVSNGAVATGDVYAQPQRTGVLWDAYLVKPLFECSSEYVLHFLACVVQRCVKQYFSWNDKCTWDKVKTKTVMLPVKSSGEPDWDYMSSYMCKVQQDVDNTLNLLIDPKGNHDLLINGFNKDVPAGEYLAIIGKVVHH